MAGSGRPQVHGFTMDIKFECATSSGAATAAACCSHPDSGLLLGSDLRWVAERSNPNPNDHPEDDVITSTGGVLNTPPPKGIVGEIAIGERAKVTEPDALEHE